MDIDLGIHRLWKGASIVGLLFALAFLGRFVTPVADGRPEVLTPVSWQAAGLARQANAEIARLATDAKTLHAVAVKEPADAIHAMTLAEHIYAAHHRGTAATAPARQALIAASEAVARYAAGGLERQTAVNAVNTALERIKALAPAPETATDAHDIARSGVRHVFLPMANVGLDAVRAGATANR
jgi:hypothetical protein